MKYIISFLVAAGFLFACGSGGSKSKTVRLEFERYGTIPDSAWIKIDNITFLHTPHDFEWNNELFLPGETEGEYLTYLPSSTVFYYFPETEKRVSEKHNNQATMLMLRTKLELFDKSENSYRITNEKELLINGKMEFVRKDGKGIEISVSEDNPLKVLKS